MREGRGEAAEGDEHEEVAVGHGALDTEHPLGDALRERLELTQQESAA